MTDEHKAALAEGREQGRVVRRYLEALESQRPKRGRRRTPESMTKRLAAIDNQLPTADALIRLHLAQERMDLEHELGAAGGDGDDLQELEAQFIEVAAAYGERRRSDLRGLASDRRGAPDPQGGGRLPAGAHRPGRAPLEVDGVVGELTWGALD